MDGAVDEASGASGPVGELIDGVCRHDRARIAAVLADQVRLSVPPLDLIVFGRAEASAAFDLVLDAFPDLDYRSVSRYVAPGQITDEAVLSGTHTGRFGYTPPTGRVGNVSARLIFAHDGDAVTELTVWPDAGALQQFVQIPATMANSANPLVTALRASLPEAGSGRVIQATSRDASATPPVVAAAPVPPGKPGRAARTAGRGPRDKVLKIPVPRRVQRRRAALLAGSMLAVSATIVAWVVSGALDAVQTASSLREPSPPAPTPTPSPSSPSTTSVPTQKPSPSPASSVTFNEHLNQFTVLNSVLFPTNGATLTPTTAQALDQVMQLIRQEHRYGVITVYGYTDTTAPAGYDPAQGRDYNMALSKRRAKAVAAALKAGLAGLPVSVQAVGMGESHPVGDNGTPDGRTLNRRVTIKVPMARTPAARTLSGGTLGRLPVQGPGSGVVPGPGSGPVTGPWSQPGSGPVASTGGRPRH